MRKQMWLVGALIMLLSCVSARAEDWPQWMGMTRDGVWHETGIVERFPEGGPPVLWRAPLAGGFSGPAVANGRVFVTDYLRTQGENTFHYGNRDRLSGKERVLCFDAKTGQELWRHEYDCQYNISYAAGPRATPTVSDGKVYALGAEGHLWCLDSGTGKVLWSRVLTKDFHFETPLWGFCGHPLVDGNKLICLVGGRDSVAVAFDKNDGKELWRSLSASEPGYCPPKMIEAGGQRQLLIWHPEAINGLDPETGKPYWSVPLKPDYAMSIASPQQSGDLLYASGIGNHAVVLRLHKDRPDVEEVWRGNTTTAVYSGNSTPLIMHGTVYGTDCQTGQLRGVDLLSGKRLWETFAATSEGNRRISHGTAFIVRNENRFFLFAETGHLILAKMSPAGYDEISRAKIVEPTGSSFGRSVVWSHPAFAGKCAFVRNDKELVCVSLAR